MEIHYYDKTSYKFVASLRVEVGSKVHRVLDLLESESYKLGMPFSRHLGAGLYELRVRSIQEIRLFYVFHEDKIIILHGFIKQSQKIPKDEVMIARQKQKYLDNE